MNPYDPVKQPTEWLAWEVANPAGGAPPTTPPPPATPGASPTAPAQLPGTTATRPTYTPNPGGGGGTRENYAASNAADKKAFQLSTGNYVEKLPDGFKIINNGQKAVRGNEAYQKDKDTNLWSATFVTKADTQAVGGLRQPGAPAAPGVTPTAGLLGGVAGSLQGNTPQLPGTGAMMPGTAGMPGTLEQRAGITLPGMDRYNLPGMGIEAEGRKTLYDNNGLNTMYASNPNGPQIQAGPGARNGRFGNNIGFGGSKSDFPGTSSIRPQMLFPGVEASVPNTYQQGVGNTGDANRAFSVPFNIGPGGASSMNIGGSNVQVNSADRGTGMGFALTPQTPSDKFAATDFGSATGRALNNDPALAAAQTMQLIAALSQLGGGAGAIDMLTAAERNQYSGNPATSQGTWFSGAPAGPQSSPLALPGEEEEKEGGGFSRFATGGQVNTLPLGALGSPTGEGGFGATNFTGAASAIDPGLMGSLTPGAGAAVQTTEGEPSLNPAENAIQPVSGPQNTTVVSPTGIAEGAPGSGQTALPQQSQVAPQPVVQPGLDPNLLTPFYESMAKQAAKNRLHTTFANRYQAAGVEAPTAIQLGPGMQMPSEYLPPGMYYDISKALNDIFGSIQSKQLDLTALGEIGDPQQLLGLLTGYETEQAPYETARKLQLELAGLGNNIPDPVQVQTQMTGLEQSMGPLADAFKAKQKLLELGPARDLTNEFNEVNYWLGQVDYYTVPEGTPENEFSQQMLGFRRQAENRLQLARSAVADGISHNSAVKDAGDLYNQVYGALGLTAEQAETAMGQFQTQYDNLKLQYDTAKQAEGLRNQITALIGSKDPIAEIARLTGKINETKQSYGNVETARQLNSQIANLAAQGKTLPGFAGGGSMSMGKPPGFDRGGEVDTYDRDDENITRGVDLGPYNSTQTYGAGGPLAPDVDKAAHDRWLEEYASKIPSTGLGLFDRMTMGGLSNGAGNRIYNQELQRLRTENERGSYLPGMRNNTGYGKVMDFAKGGNWIAGATKNSHGQFRDKAKRAGMSTKAYASKMSGAPGRTGKQARLAKTLMGFADGGAMTTQEPIIGIGMFTGQPRFQVGEPQYPGGPPMAERLQITPLNRPSALPMGRMRSAA